MNYFCENPCCENPGQGEVAVSVGGPADEKRTLCVACEEVYTWGLQHGRILAELKQSIPIGVDAGLLKQQAAALGKVVDGIPLIPDERARLSGLWEFAHSVLNLVENGMSPP